MNIGNKIKELRKKRGITQEQLASSINVSFQAVSKWENNISLPDVTLLPILASYFRVSLDTLFDYNAKEIEERALEIAKESWKYRDSDWNKAMEVLNDGLKLYPDNDIILENMLYVVDYDKEPDKTIKIASKILDVTSDDATKYDAYRFMAYAYRAKGELDSAKEVLNQIPEMYFSQLSEKANILKGEDRWHAACCEEGVALRNLIDMKYILAKHYLEKGDRTSAAKECTMALGVLDILEVSDSWNWAKEQFKQLLESIK